MSKKYLAEELKKLDKEELVNLLLAQQELIFQLREEIEQLKQERKGPTAPFRRRKDQLKGEQKKRKPGRRPKHKGAHRPRPPKVDFVEEVPLEDCPICGGAVEDLRPIEQIIEELPPIRPIYYKIKTWRATCRECGQSVCSHHPRQVSQATGAAGTHLGVNAQRWALSMIYDYGLSRRKCSRLLDDLFGLKISAGGLVHLSHRNAGKLRADYEAYLEKLRVAPAVHCDETSWYVGEPNHWLWVLTNKATTYYHVDKRRNRAVIEQLLGKDFAGTLISDCLVIYDQLYPSQQKCYAHHYKAIRVAIEQRSQQAEKTGQAPGKELEYLNKVKRLLKTAQLLFSLNRQQLLTKKRFDLGCQYLEKQADTMLLPTRKNKIEEAVANRLRKQRNHLFTFLYHPEVEPTNNLAERQLRPAVITRKISCGNKTSHGAQTWQILCSIFTTLQQNGGNFLELLSNRVLLQQQPS
jgi:transposase